MMFRWTLLEEEVSKRLKEAEQRHQEVVVLGEEKKREGEQVIEFPLAGSLSTQTAAIRCSKNTRSPAALK